MGLLAGIVLMAIMAGPLHAGTATSVTGLYYTGVRDNGATLSGGSRDSHWTVTYARVGGSVYTGNSTYTGDAYVVNNTIPSGWTGHQSNAKWITAPGARRESTSGTYNSGGAFLPGNGTEGNNSAYYVYRLAFNIAGTGTGTVENKISLSMTISADDQYAVYVNPTAAPTVNSSGVINAGGTSVSAVGYSAWNNSTSFKLQNFAGGGAEDNANFVIGTNYIYVVVANTNSATGVSNSNSLNASGLLVYQVGQAVWLSPDPVPEVGAWLPIVGAVAAFGLVTWRRRRAAVQTEPAS